MKYIVALLFSLLLLRLPIYAQFSEVSIINYTDTLGRKQGKWLSFYDDEFKKISSIKFYKDDNLDGLATNFNESGVIKEKFYFVENRLILSKTYYTRGVNKGKAEKINGLKIDRTVSKFMYVTDSSDVESFNINARTVNGLKQGLWYEIQYGSLYLPVVREFYCVGKYKDDKKVGLWKYYNYEGRQLVYIAEYVDDMLNGEFQIFDKKGTLKAIYDYVDNKQYGRYIAYYDNGSISVKASKKDGKFTGEYIEFDKKGKIKRHIRDSSINNPYK